MQTTTSTTSSKQLRCTVVTPERAVIDETCDFVALPLFDGEIGVAPGRAPMIGRLGYGEMRIKSGGSQHRYFVDGGFVQIHDNVITILTSRAIRAEDINVGAAEQVLASPSPTGSPEERDAHRKSQQRARAQLRVARGKVAASH